MLAQRGADLTRQSAKEERRRRQSKETEPAAARSQPAKRRLMFKDKHALETLPKTIAGLQAEMKSLQAKLDDPGFYARDRAGFEKVTAVARRAAAENRRGRRAMAGARNPARGNRRRLTAQPAGLRLWMSFTSVKVMPRLCSPVYSRSKALRAMKTRSPSKSSAMRGGAAAHEFVEHLAVVGRDPARERKFGLAPIDFEPVFGGEPGACSTSSCNGPTTPTKAGEPSFGRNTWATPSSASCCQRLFQLLCLHRVGQANAPQDFRREIGHAARS